MITVFAIPKPFEGHVGLIQRNALASWVRLHPDVEVILYGDDAGVGDAAREFGVKWVRDVARNQYATPLLDAIFQDAKRQARHRLVCYINADIILLQDFLEAAKRVKFRDFLMVGCRWNVDITTPLDFESPGWERELRTLVPGRATLQAPNGSDYFLFPRDGKLGNLPPFAVGRPAWDNWFLYNARSLGVPVIDATAATTVIHQNHDYRHVPNKRGTHWEGPEGDENLGLAGGWDCMFHLTDATHLMTRTSLKPAWTAQHLYRRWVTLPLLAPATRPYIDMLRTIALLTTWPARRTVRALRALVRGPAPDAAAHGAAAESAGVGGAGPACGEGGKGC